MNSVAASDVLAGAITEWLQNQVDFFENLLPAAMLVIILAVGAFLLISGKGGLKTVLGFGIGGVLVYMLLTNVEDIADLFFDEVTDTDPNTPGNQGMAPAVSVALRLAATVIRAGLGA